MFKETVQDLGILAPGNKVIIEFPYEGNAHITNIIPSCGCTQAEWDKKNNCVRLTYIPDHMPFHLVNQGKTSYEISKEVRVVTVEEQYLLTFIAKILK